MIAALIVGLIGAALTVAGFVLDPAQTFFAYVAAYACVFSTAAGALVLVLIGNATSSRWFLMFRRTGEALAASLLALAVLFVPILFGLSRLYPWARAELPREPSIAHALAHQKAVMTPTFFTVRTAIYLLVLLAVFLVLRRWSLRQDRDDDPELGRRQRTFAKVALPPVAFAITFASFDWLMSLTPAWYSSVFGIYVWVGGFDAAIALTILLCKASPPAGVTGKHFSALGRLQLAFVIFWAYIAYAQGFIIWIANKPAEVVWYVPRLTGSWGVMAIVLGFVHFVIPFALLLPRFRKYDPGYLAVPAWIVLGAHVVDSVWMVMPALHPEGYAPSWIDVGPFFLLGGFALATAIFVRARAGRVPEKAPDLPIGLAYEPQP